LCRQTGKKRNGGASQFTCIAQIVSPTRPKRRDQTLALSVAWNRINKAMHGEWSEKGCQIMITPISNITIITDELLKQYKDTIKQAELVIDSFVCTRPVNRDIDDMQKFYDMVQQIREIEKKHKL
jgi:hypothetical protein